MDIQLKLQAGAKALLNANTLEDILRAGWFLSESFQHLRVPCKSVEELRCHSLTTRENLYDEELLRLARNEMSTVKICAANLPDPNLDPIVDYLRERKPTIHRDCTELLLSRRVGDTDVKSWIRVIASRCIVSNPGR